MSFPEKNKLMSMTEVAKLFGFTGVNANRKVVKLLQGFEISRNAQILIQSEKSNRWFTTASALMQVVPQIFLPIEGMKRIADLPNKINKIEERLETVEEQVEELLYDHRERNDE